MAERVPQKEKSLALNFIAIFSMGFFDHLSSGFSLLSLYALLFFNTSQKKSFSGPIRKMALTFEKILSDPSGLISPRYQGCFHSVFVELSAEYLTF